MTRSQRISMLLVSARYSAQKSQEYMALEMNKGIRTIRNWETGKSTPNVDETIKWFEVLGLNPMPSLLALVYPKIFWELGNKKNEEVNIDEALKLIISTMSIKEKRGLIYILAGKHGSSRYSLIQMTIAHLHSSLRSRVIAANAILHNYKMDKHQGKLVCIENILPDIEDLENAISVGEDAVMHDMNGYVKLSDDGDSEPVGI